MDSGGKRNYNITMTKGFFYIVDTLIENYVNENFYDIPTYYDNRFYFGPCKKPMRPKIKPGDYIFGISPARTKPRKIVFICNVEESISFEEAYNRYPYLRGPEGPIHVKPVKSSGYFPNCSYEHIPDSIHEDDWEKDLTSPKLDAFFIGHKYKNFIGRWLGEYGPEVNNQILNFLKEKCSIHGYQGKLNDNNNDATLSNPIKYGGLFTGLHLETDESNFLLKLCEERMVDKIKDLENVPIPKRNDKKQGSFKGC